ncbi:helix-turn-helix domain-containing protein [Allostella humosa]|uniref:helix-turn-helix domain-containing protein n=1 Tax=Stella humosa TaxID=94 RepID=UPI001477833F|nr:helix-turn-helix transcriptional regulator [Stella humosa]
MVKKIADDGVIFAEEALIADVQFAIHNLLEIKDLKPVDLARILGITEPRVSQIFRDEPTNLTLRTIARIFHALGEVPQLTCPALQSIIPVKGDGRTQRERFAPGEAITQAYSPKGGQEWEGFDSEANDNAFGGQLAA